MYLVRRLPQNPIIRPGLPGLSGEDATSICGPSLVAAPEWLPGRLGRYYLYFAHHKGRTVRMAWSNSLDGPWTVHPGGVLSLDQTPAKDHIASPDVHLDEEQKLVRMYFHGEVGRTQKTFFATSSNGLSFQCGPKPLGPFYFRVIRHRDSYYAVAKIGNKSGAILRSRRPDGGFRRVRRILPDMRHAALRLEGDILHLFHSRIGDCPESILVSTIDLSRGRGGLVPSVPKLVLAPEERWEGAGLPLASSRPGPVEGPVNQLRDPAIFEDGGRLHLLYSVAGEQGIAIGELIRTGRLRIDS
jgi:hypothetical protein